MPLQIDMITAKISGNRGYKQKIIGGLKNTLKSLLNNEEVKDIIRILNCGIMTEYDEKKLDFGKVLIFSDADDDGASISNLIVTLFYVIMPDFIKQGRLGRVIPPLYKLEKGKKYKYFYTEEEYQSEKDNYNGWETTRFKGLGEMTSEDFKRTTFDNNEKRVNIFTINDYEKFEDRLQLLMGTNVKDRYDFIFNNIDFTKLRGEA